IWRYVASAGLPRRCDPPHGRTSGKRSLACTVETGWAVRRRPPGRPSTSSSLLPEYTGEMSEGPATGPSRAGSGLADTSVSDPAPPDTSVSRPAPPRAPGGDRGPIPPPRRSVRQSNPRPRTNDPGAASARRIFVLDTSVLLADPGAIGRFAEHRVVLPVVVIT